MKSDSPTIKASSVEKASFCAETRKEPGAEDAGMSGRREGKPRFQRQGMRKEGHVAFKTVARSGGGTHTKAGLREDADGKGIRRAERTPPPPPPIFTGVSGLGRQHRAYSSKTVVLPG